jgi:murein DD-endopeptidase MepM/ murein hydrolase activator NlpD
LTLPTLANLLLVVASANPSSPASAAESTQPPTVEVPFSCGRVYPVSQAHDTGSHKYHDVWAWDFRMPEGIPIVAAADGEVRLARGDSRSGGCGMEFARDANYVVIAHSGGMETQYLHFAKVTVKAGDKVKAGELIGYSGKTGWACGSHLHFKVAKVENETWNNPSIPAQLKGFGDPQAGTEIAAPSCTAERPFIAALDPSDLPNEAMATNLSDGSAVTSIRTESGATQSSAPVRGAAGPVDPVAAGR